MICLDRMTDPTWNSMSQDCLVYQMQMDGSLTLELTGFKDGALRTCCGAPGLRNYNFNLHAKCDQNGSSVCPDPTTHVSWDGIHMTEAAHRIIAQGWLHGPYVDPPIVSSSNN